MAFTFREALNAGSRKRSGRGRRRSRRRPPQTLVQRLSPSVRHPEGLPRCQFWRLREGAFHQCQHAARTGFRTCGHHGAGFAARERAGRAKNPAAVRILNGRYAKLETLMRVAKYEPRVLSLYVTRAVSAERHGGAIECTAVRQLRPAVIHGYRAVKVVASSYEGDRPLPHSRSASPTRLANVVWRAEAIRTAISTLTLRLPRSMSPTCVR